MVCTFLQSGCDVLSDTLLTCQAHVNSLSCNNFGVSGRVWMDPSGHMTSKGRLSDDAMTSVRRRYDVMCLLG